MSEINIKTCLHCSNYDALEAVGKWMLMNYGERNYKRERQIKVQSGRTFDVVEVKKDSELVTCDGVFTVTNVDS